MYNITHYMPELGSPTAGVSTYANTEDDLFDLINLGIKYLKPGQRIVIEIDEGENTND